VRGNQARVKNADLCHPSCTVVIYRRKSASPVLNVLRRVIILELICIKDEKDDLVTDFHSILARWRNYFSQQLYVHGVNDVRQTEIHTAEPLVPEPNAFEVKLAIEKLKSHKSPGIDHIPAELIEAGGGTISYEN